MKLFKTLPDSKQLNLPKGYSSGNLPLVTLLSAAGASFSHPRGPAHQKGPTLGLLLSCGHLEILNRFIFELVFC